MYNEFLSNKWDPVVFEEHRDRNYLAVLEKVRSQACTSKISDLVKDDNQKVVKQAVIALDPKGFTTKQWRVAAYYLTGKTIDISSSEQFKNMILQELS